MYAIGFDPGSRKFGIAVLKKENNSIVYIHSETITLAQDNFYLKMKTLWIRISSVLESYPVAEAAMEEGFLGKNVRSMDLVAKVRGVIIGLMIHKGLNITSFSPRQVKQALTGNGNAAKPQVEKMVKMLLNINKEKLDSDQSDALAVAYCLLLAKT